MAFCSNCGARIADNAKFCPECGSPNTSNFSDSPERQQEYVGKILKCPNCGEVLKSFEGICHSCGHEVNSVKMSASFKAFVDGITECDASIARSPVPPKNGFRTWSKRGKFWWVVLNVFTLCIPLAFYLIMPLLGIWGVTAFLPDEKRKATLIKNYAFPNDRESVLEILLYIKSQMAFIASEKIDRNSVHWANIWGNKAEQIYQKAELIIKGDAISASAHSDIVLNWKKIKKSFSIRASIALGFIAALIVFMAFSGGPLNLLSNPFKSISNPFIGNAETFEWPDTELSRLLPQPESAKGKIWDIDAESLWIEVHDFSIIQFEAYINSCKEKGFSVEGERQGNSYEARNDSGYRLKLDFTQYNLQMTIHLNEPKVIGEFQWPSTEICNLLPVPESNKGEISRSDEEQLQITVYDLSEEQCNAYIEACKENGFLIDSKTDSISYAAYNESGFHLKLHYYNVSEQGFYIVCDAPMKMETIRWPNTKLADQLPIPETDYGKIETDSKSSFTVYIGNTTPEEYADYVDACVKKGFTEGLYNRDDTHFHGDNSADSTISVDYIGFSIMKIDIYNFDY
jgi:RNA polymerase subunit RPABC4/transcription elongation factor Spt4